jgi:hypothetical protein
LYKIYPLYTSISNIYIKDSVIVVGGVDSVDRIETASYVGGDSATQTGYWAFWLRWALSSLWRESGQIINRFSTGKAVFSSIPHFGEEENSLPYLGVPGCPEFGLLGDLSTVNAIYPQIIATYPQLESPNDRYGGFPCPLNVGLVLSN